MNTKTTNSQFGTERETFSPTPDFINNYAWIPAQPQTRKSIWSDPETVKSLEKNMESLVFAYLVANLNFKNIPLKEFMDDFEKKTLLTCLGLTHGNQRNAAAILGLKPTALFEKMRKHCINGKRIKLSEKLEAVQPREIA